MNHPKPASLSWSPSSEQALFEPTAIASSAERFREPAVIVEAQDGTRGVSFGGGLSSGAEGIPVVGLLPAIYPEWLGDRSFCEVHGTRFSYVAGAMANGIATTDLVLAMAKNGMLGFFGSAGLPFELVEKAHDTLFAELGEGDPQKGQLPYGMNLIHSPHEPDLEAKIVDLYLRRKVRRVSASAYMGLTPMVVHYAISGLRQDENGCIQRDNYLFAKISRPETASKFMSPAPKAILDKLVAEGKLTAEEARLAAFVPVAEDITVEADSGGHTDNQILTAIFPTVLGQREALAKEHGYKRPIRVGAAGGLGTPSAIASAYGLGAAFVLTGSVNQGCIEGGLADYGKKLLAEAEIGDVMMAPAADMFEMGVKVQVLRRGTMFGNRAHKLYDTYRAFPSLEAIPAVEKKVLETQIFSQPLEEVWRATQSFFQKRDPKELEKAERDPKHKMALVFRAYLGQSSRWAITGDEKRKLDFQIWAGPAQCSFNAWVKGSYLEPVENRQAVQVARNLLEGAAALTRAQQMRSAGVPVPDGAFDFAPRPLTET
ncbi:MAG: PfaD family polyunsaturated fatty acid/polyketide biosynthesis protein [Deltaproteobacteria bacterium]|nr:PfaD family polyunsaturated fatty acid/polyketide biosynthesis protein [Deltaproteobacteria bacterium]